MISQGDILTEEKMEGTNVFFHSFKDKYIVMDNLDDKYSTLIKPREPVFNTQYIYVTVVLKGTLHMRISGTDFDIRENDFLAVTPCLTIEVMESRCKYVSFLTSSHIVNDIYERIGASNHAGVRCFNYHHVSLQQEHVDMIVNAYLRMKREHLREDYKRKETCLRALLSSYECHFFSFIQDYPEHNHYENTRQREFFQKFLDFLSLYCKRERSVQFYADKLKITPKYLSNLTNQYTGYSASVVIDQYVAYSIKRMLYSNEHNIKKVSDIYHFPSQSFFGRYFKRIVGMSPAAYIKENNRKAVIEE